MNRKFANCRTGPAKFWRQEHSQNRRTLFKVSDVVFQKVSYCLLAACKYSEVNRRVGAIGTHIHSICSFEYFFLCQFWPRLRFASLTTFGSACQLCCACLMVKFCSTWRVLTAAFSHMSWSSVPQKLRKPSQRLLLFESFPATFAALEANGQRPMRGSFVNICSSRREQAETSCTFHFFNLTLKKVTRIWYDKDSGIEFACPGLRTLCLAERVLTNEEFEDN